MISAVNFEELLYNTLIESNEIKSIVGEKIFPLVIPKGTLLPCISFQRIEGKPANTLLGHSGLEQITVQIDAWSLQYSESKDLAIAIRKAMPSQGEIWGSHLIEDRDLYDCEDDDSTGYYRVMMRYIVWFLENANE